MSGDGKQVHELAGSQRGAVDPQDSVWLSASAGTGKTQVLSSRVLRLLLRPEVTPGQILCLTFTKAGAAEMASRINETLARWVRLEEGALGFELKAIGADFGPDTCKRARTLFAAVLDCPGGGLRIDTIHAFAQWLLSAFPKESGLLPGSRPIEDRERALLARRTLAELLLEAEDRGEGWKLAALEALSIRLGPDAAESWLLQCAQAREAWFGAGSWHHPFGNRLHTLLGLPDDFGEPELAAMCGDDAFDVNALECCLSAYSQWIGKKGQSGRIIIKQWCESETSQRLESLDGLHKVLFTQKDTVRDAESLSKFESEFLSAAESVLACSLAVRERRNLLALSRWLEPVLGLGRAFAIAWNDAKEREGLVDFDDQIRLAATLLDRSDMGEWIRYKLDRRFDHILVDEAQDTNAAQWRIVKALTGDFFAGEGARADRQRTVFVVGDYKQAIFGFQGTSPENFRIAQDYFDNLMREAAANAEQLRDPHLARPLQKLGLERSFRTVQPVLDFVDKAIASIGAEAFGLDALPEPHQGDDKPGQVVLWQPIGGEVTASPEDDEPEGPDWLSKPDRDMADRIARQVREWLDQGYPLRKGTPRHARAGDVMVLVRKRRELAGLIVARLHAHGVPVAGVDRLRLGAPLAVKDLMAALRFAVQPLDSLNLAALLVSPLVGWTQEELLEHGWRGKHGPPLWEHLRQSSAPLVAATLHQLGELLARADYAPPQALLHWLLVGPWQGRRRLVARLGREAEDPIEELVNAAHAYTLTAIPSLAGFIAWFDAGEGELKREAGRVEDQVRVMTVHGAKGLQAPIVILADAVGNPRASAQSGSVNVPEPQRQPDQEPISLPLPPLAKADRLGRIRDAAAEVEAAELQEHWRLLYVAMTRAEEALFIGGALGSREKEPAPDSWYARLSALLPIEEAVSDSLWGAIRTAGIPPEPLPFARPPEQAPLPFDLAPPQPAWLTATLAPEPRPAKPLAPSSLGEDAGSDPPNPPGALADAARRGVLVHKLLERLPEVPEREREAVAQRWLARNAADLVEEIRTELARSAIAVIGDVRWADVFSADALAEVPVAALVGTQVVAGTIDRLVIRSDRLTIVDFKTARRPPMELAQVPESSLRQMASYAAALEVTYPGRTIEAALLYTHVPRMIAVPAAVLAPHKQALMGKEESF